MLGRLYEHISLRTGQQHGLVYTPPRIAELVAARAFAARPAEGSIRLADPACGAGALLIASLRLLASSGGTGRGARELAHSLFGVDRDPVAVGICRLCLTIELAHAPAAPPAEEILSITLQNIRCGDSLLPPTGNHAQSNLSSHEPFAWHSAFQPVFEERGGFDYIIGNPPYTLARDGSIQQEELVRLKHLFGKLQPGKVNTYLLFLHRGFELLREGGALSMIIPNAWHGIRSGRELRTTWLADGSLHEVVTFDGPVFPDRSVEPVIVTVRKSAPQAWFRVRRASSSGTLPGGAGVRVSARQCLAIPDAVIPLAWNDETSELWSTVWRNSAPLIQSADLFRPLIALQAYARGKGSPPQTRDQVKGHVYHSDSPLDESSLPYLEGADVTRYRVAWSGRYLQYGPWLAEPQSIDRFSGPRILVREILGLPPRSVSAAYLDTPALYNKSVLHILPGPRGNEELLLALLAILNSRFGSFVFASIGRKAQRRLFPKIVAADLKAFPLPSGFAEAAVRLGELAQRRLDLTEATPESNPASLVEAQIEALIGDVYGLSQHHLRTMREFFSDVPTSKREKVA